MVVIIPNLPDPSSQKQFFDYTDPNQLDIFAGIAVDTIKAVPPPNPCTPLTSSPHVISTSVDPIIPPLSLPMSKVFGDSMTLPLPHTSTHLYSMKLTGININKQADYF
jgi:hypothetical protein